MGVAALSEEQEFLLLRVLRRCVTAGWVDFEGGDRPVAVLTESGVEVMRGDRPAPLRLPSRTERRASRRRAKAVPADALDAPQRELFEALRRHRMEIARAESVPPYVVATDRALREIAMLRPTTPEELEQAHGVGPAKVARYGAGLLDVVRSCDGTDRAPGSN